MLKATLTSLTFLCAVPPTLPQSTRPVSERRFAERLNVILKGDPNFLRNVRSQRGFPPELAFLKWLLGSWKASGKMYQTASTPERAVPDGGNFTYKTVPDSSWIWGLSTRGGTGVFMPLIGYDRPSKRYVLDFCNYAGTYGVLTSPGPKGDSITFEGDATVFNISVHMRQTYVRDRDLTVRIKNEERMPDGSWLPIDETHLIKEE